LSFDSPVLLLFRRISLPIPLIGRQLKKLTVPMSVDGVEVIAVSAPVAVKT
jgi:hypothetical protein